MPFKDTKQMNIPRRRAYHLPAMPRRLIDVIGMPIDGFIAATHAA